MKRRLLRAWRILPKFAILVICLAVVAVVYVVRYYGPDGGQPAGSSSGTRVKDILDSVSSIATVAALVIGGYWTYSLFVRQRQLYPRATIAHTIVHRRIDENWILLHVTANISNSGSLLLPLRYLLTRVQQVLPLPEDQMEQVQQAHSLVRDGETEVRWDVLDERESNWAAHTLEIEPGDSQAIHYDFVIDSEPQLIKVSTWLRNEVKKQEGQVIGFSCSTLYDLREPNGNGTS